MSGLSNYDFDDYDDDFELNSDFEPESDFEQEQDQDQDVPDREIDEENEEDGSPQSCRTSPTWKYFDEQTSQYPGRPVCYKCKQVFGKKTGITTLKRHLLSAHKIKIDNVKSSGNNQSTLKFKCTDPWPEKEKKERDNAVVEWVIGDAQPF